MKRARSVTLPTSILHSLAELQDGLNSMIDTNWRKVRSPTDWTLAITMESTELLDSYPWKWWKNINATPDFDNVKIELVDILHFSLSGTMQMRSMAEDDTDAAEAPITGMFSPRHGENTPAVHNSIYLPLTSTENAIASFRNVIQLANKMRFDVITEGIICAADDLGFNLVAYYVAKHTLNCIRQLGGYKDGTYVKVNNGVEDNVLLHKCIEKITVSEALDEENYIKTWNNIMEDVYEAFQVAKSDRKDFEYWRRRPQEDAAAGSS